MMRQTAERVSKHHRADDEPLRGSRMSCEGPRRLIKPATYGGRRSIDRAASIRL